MHIIVPLLKDLHAAEAHEGQSEQRCGHEADRETFEAFRVLCKLNALAHGGKQNDSKQEAEAAGDTVNGGLDEVVLILNVQKNNPESWW